MTDQNIYLVIESDVDFTNVLAAYTDKAEADAHCAFIQPIVADAYGSSAHVRSVAIKSAFCAEDCGLPAYVVEAHECGVDFDRATSQSMEALVEAAKPAEAFEGAHYVDLTTRNLKRFTPSHAVVQGALRKAG